MDVARIELQRRLIQVDPARIAEFQLVVAIRRRHLSRIDRIAVIVDIVRILCITLADDSLRRILHRNSTAKRLVVITIDCSRNGIVSCQCIPDTVHIAVRLVDVARIELQRRLIQVDPARILRYQPVVLCQSCL